MSKTNNFLFRFLHVIAWIIFVGLCIEAGALIVNFLFTVFKPASVGKLYQKLDLTNLYAVNQWAFYGVYSFILFIALMKAHLFYLLVRLLHKMDLQKPFNSFVSEQITQISYYTFSIGLISYIARETTRNMQHHSYDVANVTGFWADSQAYLLMAAVIYVIATIFKKGVELQNENDLTV